jgi:hypothetical protein
MLDALAPDRSDQPFGEAVLPRRGWGNGLVTYAHGAQSARDGSAIDAIPITDQIARGLIPRECLRDLECDPFRRKVGHEWLADKHRRDVADEVGQSDRALHHRQLALLRQALELCAEVLCLNAAGILAATEHQQNGE